MGGFAGHMNHLYDNPGLTFKKMKDIFAQASNGNIEGTEKTDGQNLFVSYSVQTGQAKGVRNKGEILAGGMNAEQLALKFAGHANPNIKEVFVDAFETFEKAVQSLDPELQIKIFGTDADVFYNSEIQDPRTRNVIAYDEKLLNIHQVGHVILDKENKQIKTKGFETYYRELDKALEMMQTAIQEREYNVQKNAVRRLRALDDDIALNTATERLENELRKVGISDNQAVFDYLMEKLISYIDGQIPNLPEENKKTLLKRLFKEMEPKFKGITFNHVVKGLDKETKERVRALIHDEKNILKLAIFPIEDIVHDFSVAMLKGLESFFVLDNVKEVMRLRSEVTKAIAAIEKSGSEDAIRILKKEMKKLKSIENVTTAVEGFVFDYDGVTYKFTGNFAPANQILGLFKYGRKGIPPLELASEEEPEESDIEGCKKTHIIFPGAFKPPHRGHYNLVEHYSHLYPGGIIKILISPLPASDREGFDSETQADVSVEDSVKIWERYTSNLPNVEISVSEMRTPVRAAYEYVGKNGPMMPGECALPAASNKGGDEARWKSFMKNSDKYVKPGVKLIDPLEHVYKVEGKPLHASNFRVAMKNGDTDVMEEFLPKHLQNNASEILDILGISVEPTIEFEENKKKRSFSSILHGLIEESLNEGNYQKSQRVTDYLDDWREMHASGPQDPGSAFPNNRPSKRSKSGPPGFAFEEVESDEEIIEEDDIEETNAIEFVAGSAGDLEARYEDPNSRELDKKSKIKIFISHPSRKELEEISAMGAGAVEGGGGSPWINFKSGKKDKEHNEEFINEVLNYLVKGVGE